MKLILLIGLSAISTWATSATDTPPIRIASIQEFGQFNPITMNLASTGMLSDFVIRGITNRNALGEVIPDLAETVPTVRNGGVREISDNGKKKLIVSWRIKANAKWGDGKPVICEDWKTAWKIGLSENVSTIDHSVFTKIENIDSISNPKLCTVTYSDANWTYDRDLPIPVPTHLEKSIFEKWGKQKEAYDQNSLYVREPTNPGLYNGPYLISEYKLGSHIIFKINPNFYGTAAKLEPVLVRFIPDPGTLKAHLETGDINLIAGNGFPPDMAIAMSETFSDVKAPFSVKFYDSASTQGIFPNHDDEVLKDKRVREALDMAIDRTEITKAFFKGKFLPAYTFLPPQTPEFKMRKSTYSLAKAKALLTAAGWVPGEKGVRKKNGKELRIQFRTSSGIKFLETLQAYLCGQFSKVGAQCVIENQPPRVLLGDTVAHGDFSLAMFGQPVVPDSSLQSLFSSHEIPNKTNSFTGGNISRVDNKNLDDLLGQFDTEWDRKKRGEIISKIEDQVIRNVDFIPLYHRREADVLPRALSGFNVGVDGMVFFQPETWRLE